MRGDGRIPPAFAAEPMTRDNEQRDECTPHIDYDESEEEVTQLSIE